MILTTTLEGADEAVGGFEEIAKRCDDLSAPLERLGIHHQRKAARILRSGERGVRARHPGGLADSITYAQPAQNALVVGSNKVYAAAQQFGGTLESSRPGGFLAIPIADNLAGRKDPKFDSPREVADGFFFKSKKGNLLFARRKSRKNEKTKRRKKGSKIAGAVRAGIELLFVLKKSVTIPRHRYVTHDPEDQTRWDRFVGRWILQGKT